MVHKPRWSCHAAFSRCSNSSRSYLVDIGKLDSTDVNDGKESNAGGSAVFAMPK